MPVIIAMVILFSPHVIGAVYLMHLLFGFGPFWMLGWALIWLCALAYLTAK